MSPDEPEARLTAERWREVEALFLATRDRELGERARFLEVLNDLPDLWGHASGSS